MPSMAAKVAVFGFLASQAFAGADVECLLEGEDGSCEMPSTKSNVALQTKVKAFGDSRLKEEDAAGTLCNKVGTQLSKQLQPPVEVQKILNFMIGFSWGVNYKNVSAVCKSLPLDKDTQYATVTVGTGLLQGIHAELKKRELEKDKEEGGDAPETASIMDKWKGGIELLMPSMPLCVAMRPCGPTARQEETWLKEWDFGFIYTKGITVFVSASPPLEFKLYGLTFSSAGGLALPKLTSPLFGYAAERTAEVTSGLHWWLKCSMEFPIPDFGMKVGMTGTVGAYVEYGGRPDIAAFLAELVSEDGWGTESLLARLPQDGFFRMAGTTNSVIQLDMKKIFGQEGERAEGEEVAWFKLSAQTSVVREAKLDRGNREGSYIAEYLSARASVKLSEFLDVSDFLKKLFGSFSSELDIAWFLKGRVTKYFDAGFRLGWTGALTCDAIDVMPSYVPDIFPKLSELLPFCGGTEEVSLELMADLNKLSKAKTCFTIRGKRFCLDELPSCPRPVTLGDSCSENADCVGEEYGPTGRGYCQARSALGSTAFCAGRCVKLAPAGHSCGYTATNVWNVATSAENEKCESHWQGTRPACLCAKCVGSSGRLPDSSWCATDANCESGYCHKGGVAESLASVGCKGTCTAKRAADASCSFNAECASGSCSTGCRSLFHCVTSGKCVECLDSSHCGSGQYCDNHECYDKKDDYAGSDAWWKCKSGKDICGRCAASDGRVHGRYRCSQDSDCGSGLRCGSWWHNCWGCKCHCYSR